VGSGKCDAWCAAAAGEGCGGDGMECCAGGGRSVLGWGMDGGSEEVFGVRTERDGG